MKLTVNNPCEMDWDRMSGGERRRFCESCDKHVHDLGRLTEVEAQTLLAEPGVCARFQVDSGGNVRFRDSQRSAAAMVMAAVFAATPAYAGGKAAHPDADPGWGQKFVEWVESFSDVGVLGEVQPLEVPPVEVVPRTEPEPFLMGDVAEIIEPAQELEPEVVIAEVKCPEGASCERGTEGRPR